jgi:hypothetical protein
LSNYCFGAFSAVRCPQAQGPEESANQYSKRAAGYRESLFRRKGLAEQPPILLARAEQGQYEMHPLRKKIRN